MMEVLTDDATDGGGRNRLLDEAIASGSTVSCKYIFIYFRVQSYKNVFSLFYKFLFISLWTLFSFMRYVMMSI